MEEVDSIVFRNNILLDPDVSLYMQVHAHPISNSYYGY